MNKVLKYWSVAFGIVMALLAVFGWFYDKGEKDSNIENRIHKTPEQLLKVDTHVNNALTPTQELYEFLIDSVEKNDRIKTRAKRLKAEEAKDSIWADRDLKNAIQIFQMRNLFDSIVKLKQEQ